MNLTEILKVFVVNNQIAVLAVNPFYSSSNDISFLDKYGKSYLKNKFQKLKLHFGGFCGKRIVFLFEIFLL
jgi:hypothetical protein